jgi:hypothetical protein
MSTLAKKQNLNTADRSRSKAPIYGLHKQVTHFNPLQSTAGNQAVQRLMRSANCGGGSSHKSIHEAADRATRGSGRKFPFLNQIQRAFGRHDISHARAHEGSHAANAARALGASAFTTGHHVAFAGAPNLHTAAHEATHIVQQRAGVKLAGKVGQVGDVYERHADAVADRVVRGELSERLLDAVAPRQHEPHAPGGTQMKTASGQAPLVQLKKVSTGFGTFEDIHYGKLTNEKNEAIGCEMYLRFNPGKNVDATKIGLTQSAKSSSEGYTFSSDPLNEEHLVKSGKAKAFMIDTLSDWRSPIYGATKPGTGDADKFEGWDISSKVKRVSKADQKSYASRGLKGVKYGGMGQYGFRKKSAAKWKTQPAELSDWPHISSAGDEKNSGQTLETTALAIEGTQKDTYYGSVQWGWERDSKGEFKLIDFKAVSQGAPSAIFLAAAEQWNVSTTSAGDPTIKLPTLDVYTTSKEIEILAGAKKIKLPAGTRVQVISKGAQTTDPWTVNIVDGPHVGKQVSMDESNLTKE